MSTVEAAVLRARLAIRHSRLSVRKGRQVVLLVSLVVLGLKMVVVIQSGGTNDISHWTDFTYLAGKYGPVEMYDHTVYPSYYNHPPLMGYVLELVHFNTKIGIPVKVSIRTAASIADVVTAVVVFELVRRRRSVFEATAGGLIVALSPVLFSISAFHGNTDPVFTMLVMLSLYLLVYRRSPAWAGVVIALGIGVKLPAVVALPCLFVFAWSGSRRTLKRFGLSFAAVFVVTWGPALLFRFSQVKSHVLQYDGGGPRPWGLVQFAHWAHGEGVKSWLVGPAHLPIVAICALLPALAVWRRPNTVAPAVALSLCLFLALSPAFAVQYLAWPAAATVVLGFWRAVMYNVSAGALLFHEYTRWSDDEFPWPSRVVNYSPSTPAEIYFLVVVWVILLMACWKATREVFASAPPSAPPSARHRSGGVRPAGAQSGVGSSVATHSETSPGNRAGTPWETAWERRKRTNPQTQPFR